MREPMHALRGVEVRLDTSTMTTYTCVPGLSDRKDLHGQVLIDRAIATHASQVWPS